MMRSPGRSVPSRIERRMARSASSLLDATSGALKMSVGSIIDGLCMPLHAKPYPTRLGAGGTTAAAANAPGHPQHRHGLAGRRAPPWRARARLPDVASRCSGSWPSCRRRSASGSSQATSRASRPTSAGPSCSPGCSRWRSRRSRRSRSATGSPSTRARRPGISPRSSSSPRGGHDLAADHRRHARRRRHGHRCSGWRGSTGCCCRVFTPLTGMVFVLVVTVAVMPTTLERAVGVSRRRRRAGRPPDGSRPRRRSPSRSCSSAAVRCARTRCSARCWRGRRPRS